MVRVDVSAEILGMTIDPPVMNASGVLSYVPVLRRVQEHFGALVTKSVGYREREGYDNPVFVQLSEKDYINAVGLPNPGYREFLEELLEAYPMRRPLIASMFGSSVSELREMASQMQYACDAIELNLSHPHPKPGEKMGRDLGSDPVAVEAVVDAVKRASSKPVIAKLSWSLDDLEASARACIRAGCDAISSSNTIGPADSSSPRIRWPVLSNVKGGLSGPGIKARAIESVRRIRAVDPKIPIIGIGGISSGRDIVEYIRAGADAVALGTALDLKDTREIGHYMGWLVEDLRQEMKGMGAMSLKELRHG